MTKNAPTAEHKQSAEERKELAELKGAIAQIKADLNRRDAEIESLQAKKQEMRLMQEAEVGMRVSTKKVMIEAGELLDSRKAEIAMLRAENADLKQIVLNTHLKYQNLKKESEETFLSQVSMLRSYDRAKSKEGVSRFRLEQELKASDEAGKCLLTENQKLVHANNVLKTMGIRAAIQVAGLDENDQAMLACYFSQSFGQLDAMVLNALDRLFDENARRLGEDPDNQPVKASLKDPEQLLAQIRSDVMDEDAVDVLDAVLRGFSRLVLESQDWDEAPVAESEKDRIRFS